MNKKFVTLGIPYLDTLSKAKIIKFYKDCNDKYYNEESQPLLTDDQYDILYDYVKQKYPSCLEIGSTVSRKKVRLPFFMPSMNKLKSDEKQLENWKQRHPGNYVFSTKLDGVSALLDTRNGQQKMYSRGDGVEGQDISHLIPYLHLDSVSDIVVRGELIIPKEYEITKLRNTVSGLVNSKEINTDKIKMVHFVVYELMEPVLSPSQQFLFLEKNYPVLELAQHFSTKQLNTTILSNTLLRWRDECPYEIDGVICANDIITERKNENPSHAFAFKMVLTEQMMEAIVMDVIWNISKDGYLIPKVRFDPVEISGIRIEYATAFNAKFVKENGIGIGTRVVLIRSGDVIPYILKVLFPTEPKMPLHYEYVWTKNNVDIVLKNKDTNPELKKKEVVYFFEGLKIDGFGKKTIEKVYDSGINTIPDILAMGKENLLALEGIKETLANKIIDNRNTTIEHVSLEKILSYSNILERGFAEKKINTIISNIPNWNEIDVMELKEKISTLKGFTDSTAELFSTKRDLLLSFLQDTNLTWKLMEKKNVQEVITDGKLKGKSVVLSGFRDEDLENRIKKEGGTVSTTISKNTDYLIVKTNSKETAKTKKARDLGIEIVLKENVNNIF